MLALTPTKIPITILITYLLLNQSKLSICWGPTALPTGLLTSILFHSEIMLTFVSVFVLAVIGTQAAPQFQPADAAQQPNVPSVTILTQTDSIGADGSFNNRCDLLSSENISVFNVNKKSF